MYGHSLKHISFQNLLGVHLRLISVPLMLLAVVLMQSTLAAEDKTINPATKAEIKRLQSLWKSWDKSVTSLELKGFRCYESFSQDQNWFSYTDFEKRIYDHIIPLIESDKITQKKLQATLDASPSLKGYWRPFTFTISKDATRLDDTIGGKTFSVVRIDDQEFSYFETSRQANVYGTFTGLKSLRVSEYLYRPYHTFQNDQWDLSCSDDKTCQLKLNTMLIEYDKQSGMIKHFQVRSRKNKLIRKRIQTNEIVSKTGVPIPRLIAVANSSRGSSSISSINLTILSQIKVNPEISPERFHLAVPAGVNVVKFKSGTANHIPTSQGGARPRMRRTPAPISDLRNFATQF
ncbi:hypothetical protein [Gimesia aquarii]|uniref:Uncharacterized protein n=1 Tax=Gimesia aquarii TaxID=2527964 RepID=A0A517WUR1_9PLAN|nr:hypothetical protein [Gimesia aquarii]QDU08999.1 hypothetical protein V202x_23690 [Gimesia aquarii]